MKATGIVRRIDDLGRVVIPKEIRRTMRIREGDPLEIFTTRDGEVILRNIPSSVGWRTLPPSSATPWPTPPTLLPPSPTEIASLPLQGPENRELIRKGLGLYPDYRNWRDDFDPSFVAELDVMQ